MEHTEHTFLGIDLGTSAMKLVLIDGNKNVLEQITEEYQAVQPERGFSEIDPEIWYDCMVNAMDRILMQCDRSRIRGIGVTGQMHTLVVLDAEGKPVRPAMMWNDIRTRDLIPRLKEGPTRVGRSEEVQATVYQKHRALQIRKKTYRA